MNHLHLSAALLVLLYAGLSTNVSLTRIRKRRRGTVTDAQLLKAIRAHGNASEYIPLFVAGFLYLGVQAAHPLLSALGAVAVLSRISHAAGMFVIPSVDQRHPFKFWGATGTYVTLFGLGAALLKS